MLKLLLPFAVLVLLHTAIAEAQTDVSIVKKEFKKDKTGFDDAWGHINKADDYYQVKGVWYNNAFDEYLKAIVYNNSNAELNYKTGVSALFSDNREEASGFLLKALELKSDVAGDVLLLTGRALQYSGKYSEAIEKLNGYVVSSGKKSVEDISVARRWIEECNSALIITNDTLRVELVNAGASINSANDDYSVLPTTYSDTRFDENIFVSRNINDSWEKATIIGKELSSKYCEAPLYVNNANDQLYIYTGFDGGGDIQVSEYKKDKWRAPEAIPYNINTSGSESSFAFSPSGNEIYYVTNGLKDKIGGKDIYFISKLTDRKWSKPKNVGSSVNTIYDEESVRFSKSGDTLWFCSKGHNSIGGYDVFYSVRNQAGLWDTAKNIGFPVNTAWNEMFYHPSPDDDSAFYIVSDRSGGLGGLDIYFGRILPPEPEPIPAPPAADTVVVTDTVVVVMEVAPPPVEPVITRKEEFIYLTGTVQDSETGDPVLAKIDLIDMSTDLIVLTTASSDIDGSYRIRLPERKSYMIDFRATGFLSDMKRVSVPDTLSDGIVKLDVSLVKVKVGKKVVMNNIFFETGKAVLTLSSYAEIDRLVNFMQDNLKMRIEISGHTDKTGSEPVNFRLSESRAKAVYDYLIQKGVDSKRIEYVGFGSLQPVDDNSTPQGRAKNRRVEFKILEF